MFWKSPLAQIISLLPGSGYELVCPLFDGAIVRPVSASACIDGLRADVAQSFGVEIRSRNVSPLPVDEVRVDTDATSVLTPVSGIPSISTAASGRACAGAGDDSGCTTGPYIPGDDATSISDPGEAGKSGASMMREKAICPTVSSSLAAHPLPRDVMRGGDVDPASINKADPPPPPPPRIHPLLALRQIAGIPR